MPSAAILDLDYELAANVLDNERLERELSGVSAEKIFDKTGIKHRRVAEAEKCASDLATRAAEKLFARLDYPRGEIDALLFCTQTPDYFLPTTACLLQHRLGLSESVAALDFNLGCSGYVYGLGLAKGLIETAQANCVLLLTGDTYSKLIPKTNRTVRTLFGDAAAATLVVAKPGDSPSIGPFVYGTDGSAGKLLMVERGAFRNPADERHPPELTMDGAGIFSFTIKRVPESVRQLLQEAELGLDDIDLFVFHQANGYMLDHLKEKLGIPDEKFFVYLEDCGNTVSSSIPVALKEASAAGVLRPGMRVMLVGFGVGLSWASALVRW